MVRSCQFDKDYQYGQSSKANEENGNLKRHNKMLHEGIKVFQCDHCSDSFGRKSNLHRHIKTSHETAKGFQCDQCTKSYGQKCDQCSIRAKI